MSLVICGGECIFAQTFFVHSSERSLFQSGREHHSPSPMRTGLKHVEKMNWCG